METNKYDTFLKLTHFNIGMSPGNTENFLFFSKFVLFIYIKL